jgi:hypothetical protein
VTLKAIARGRAMRIFLGLSAVDLFVWYMRTLIRRSYAVEPRRRFWWAWFVYHGISGYPPGELHHWPEYPRWLKDNPRLEDALISAVASRGDPETEVGLREWWATDGWYTGHYSRAKP